MRSVGAQRVRFDVSTCAGALRFATGSEARKVKQRQNGGNEGKMGWLMSVFVTRHDRKRMVSVSPLVRVSGISGVVVSKERAIKRRAKNVSIVDDAGKICRLSAATRNCPWSNISIAK